MQVVTQMMALLSARAQLTEGLQGGEAWTASSWERDVSTTLWSCTSRLRGLVAHLASALHKSARVPVPAGAVAGAAPAGGQGSAEVAVPEVLVDLMQGMCEELEVCAHTLPRCHPQQPAAAAAAAAPVAAGAGTGAVQVCGHEALPRSNQDSGLRQGVQHEAVPVAVTGTGVAEGGGMMQQQVLRVMALPCPACKAHPPQISHQPLAPEHCPLPPWLQG